MKQFIFLFNCLTVVLAWDWNETSTLDEYVNAIDPELPEWGEKDEFNFDSCRVNIYNFTSLIWEDEMWSSQSVWWHYLIVAHPNADKLRFMEDAIYIIDGRSNSDHVPNATDTSLPFACLIANQTEAAVALIRMIPNQPIIYTDDQEQKERSGHDSIAYTWRWLLDNDNEQPEHNLIYPMTKAAIKGLDVVHTVLQLQYSESDIDVLVIGGNNLQGTVAWLMACTDQRVKFVVPMASSLINIIENLKRHYQSLGGWSFAFLNYYLMNITAEIDTSLFGEIMAPIDPYNYLPRLTMPKLIISATGDTFFLPDDTHLYFDDLPEPKYIIIMQNANKFFLGHWQKVLGSIMTLFFLMKEPGGVENLPKLEWFTEWDEVEERAQITLNTSSTPDLVTAYWADTPDPEHRDFRMITAEGMSEVVWHRWWRLSNGTLEQIGDDTYRYTLDEPSDASYRGMFINVRYNIPRYEHLNITLQLTTEVQILPDTFPIPPCSGASCKGQIV